MSFDQLLDVDVSVASLEAERIDFTPAVVSSYSQDQLMRFGLTDIREFLNFIPGFVIQDSAIGTSAIMVRGLVEPFNQKVLFLLNGVPYWQPAHGDNALLGIQTSLIERIEVIRGPGAVIYGTNASAGVINVITKDDGSSFVRGSLGNQNRREFSTFINKAINEDLRLSLGVDIANGPEFSETFTNRPSPGFFPVTAPADATIEKDYQRRSVMFELDYKSLSVMLHGFESETRGLAGPASSFNVARLEYQGELAHLNYRANWLGIDWNLYTDFNRFDLSIPTQALFFGSEFGVQHFEDDGDDNYRWRSGFNGQVRLNDSLTWLFGSEYEKRSTGAYLNVDTNGEVRATTLQPKDIEELGVLTQVDYVVGDWRWLLGIRAVDNNVSGNRILPRVSVVKRLSPKSSFKVLYATGFNSPNLIQLGIQIPPNVVQGNPNLKAETIDSFEVAYTFQDEKNLFVANLFYLEASDFIQRVPNGLGGVIYENAENFDRKGVSLEWQRISDAWVTMANLNYLPDGNDFDQSDATAVLAPEITASIGFSYQKNRSNYGASIHYTSERAAADANFELNLNYQYRWDQHRLNLVVSNLLGDALEFSDIQDLDPNRIIPGGDSNQRVLVTYDYFFSL